jgi:hypothetical protein
LNISLSFQKPISALSYKYLASILDRLQKNRNNPIKLSQGPFSSLLFPTKHTKNTKLEKDKLQCNNAANLHRGEKLLKLSSRKGECGYYTLKMAAFFTFKMILDARFWMLD